MGKIVLLSTTPPPLPKQDPTNLRLPHEAPTFEQFGLHDDGEGLPLATDPRNLKGYKQP